MPVILIIAAVIVLSLAGLYAIYYKVFYSPKKNMSETVPPENITNHIYRDIVQDRTDELNDIPNRLISTRSRDGLRLSARYFQGDADKPLFICFHGYRGSAPRDLSGIGLYLIRKDYNVILPDQRAHWGSQGHTISFGVKERFDVLSWIKYANRHFGPQTPIYLYGISMGGACVLMASGLGLPDNVRGVIADCPYNVPKDIIQHVCRKSGLNPTLCWPGIRLSALIWGRFNINATTAAREARRSKTPIMIIHGEADHFVPMRMSMEIARANPAVTEAHTVPNAGHGLSYFYDTEGYQALVREFIRKTS